MRPTALQRKVIGLRDDEGQDFAQIAKGLGRKIANVRQIYVRGKRRVSDDLEKNPAQTADVLAAATNPLRPDSYSGIARETGVDERTVKHILQRAQEQLPQVVTELRQFQTEQLQGLLDHNSGTILEAVASMTNEELKAEGVKNLAISASLMLEKRALLRKEPTQRIHVDDRRHMEDLLAAAIDEMARRGLHSEVDPIDQTALVHDGDIGSLNRLARHKVIDGEIVERAEDRYP